MFCDYLLGQIVGRIFANGTGARLTYISSEMEFLPVRGTLYGLTLKRPEDAEHGGISIERISVRLHLLPLFKERVDLSHLTLDGVTIIAEQDQSAFWSLLDYLFGGDQPQSGWPVSVSDVRVRTRNKAGSLTLAGEDYRLEGNSVDFYAKTASPAPEDPFKTTVTADALDVQIAKAPKLPLNAVKLLGDLGNGKFSFTEATARSADLELSAPFKGVFTPVHVESAVELKFAAENFIAEQFGDSAEKFAFGLDVDANRLQIHSAPATDSNSPVRSKVEAEIKLSHSFPLQAAVETTIGNQPQKITVSGDLLPLGLKADLESTIVPRDEEDGETTEAAGSLISSLSLQNDNLRFEVHKREAPYSSSKEQDGFDGQGSWNLASGVLQFDLSDVHQRYKVVARRIDVAAAERRLNFTDTEITAAGESMRLNGTLSKDGWQAGLQGKWDLGPIGDKFPRLEQVSGELNVNLQITGAAFDPILDGTVNVEQGSVSLLLGTTIVGADNFKLSGRFLNDELIVDSMSANVGGGILGGGGHWTSLFDQDKRSGELNFALEGIDFEPVTGAYVNLKGYLALRDQPGALPELTGEVTSDHALYEKNVDIRQIVQALSQFIVGRGHNAGKVSGVTLGEGLSYDVHLLSPGGMLVDTNVAQAELRADLQLLGDTQNPYLEGEIQVLNGVFGFQAQEFQLTNAEMTFTPDRKSLDPELNILGETILKTTQGDEQRVFLAINGTLTQPKLNFSSDSGMSENEIVSLLGLSGAAGIQIIGREGVSAGYAEVFNPNSDLSLRDRIGGITGLSEVQIVPSFSTTTGEFAPKVIGTRPLIGGLELKLESELTSQQASGAEIEFPLTRSIKAQGGWKTTPITGNVRSASGAFNVGVRFEQHFPGTGLLPPRGFNKFKEIGEEADGAGEAK